MRLIVRWLIIVLCLIFLWPFFLLKKLNNKVNYKKVHKTIFVANHYSNADSFYIYLAFGFKNKIRFVTYGGVKKKLITRILCWAFDCIYVSENALENVKTIKECMDYLNKGGNIAIFPEGVINPTKYSFFVFSKSFCYLARKTHSKILPLYIYPNSGIKISYLYVGELITPETLAEMGDDESASIRIQSKIMDYSVLVEETMNKNKKEQ